MILETINLLGKKAKDKVTGYNGVISSVAFDLYGCVVAVLTPPFSQEKEPHYGRSFDIQRLEVSSEPPVMQRPHFEAVARVPSDYTRGMAERPPISG